MFVDNEILISLLKADPCLTFNEIIETVNYYDSEVFFPRDKVCYGVIACNK